MFGSMGALVVPDLRAVAGFRFLAELLHSSVKPECVAKGSGNQQRSKATKGHERFRARV